jgi:hypothetical protein
MMVLLPFFAANDFQQAHFHQSYYTWATPAFQTGPQPSFEVQGNVGGGRYKGLSECWHGLAFPRQPLDVFPAQGLGAVLYLRFGLKDHVRAAIQILFGEVPEWCLCTHTG